MQAHINQTVNSPPVSSASGRVNVVTKILDDELLAIRGVLAHVEGQHLLDPLAFLRLFGFLLYKGNFFFRLFRFRVAPMVSSAKGKVRLAK